MPQLQHNDYKVGWICALPKEQTAAMAMLDVRHTNLPKPPTDPNAYTLGSIGDHNIVIACLPKGQYGTVSASVVATNMASTFPAIRFGLMVGIGGGIPPKVRLGDVVVSVPVDQFPGVVQWDMGKAEEGDTFRRTGALNNPPTLLLTALTQLESDHEMIGPGFPQFLEELATKFPRLASKYATSEHLQDILFDKDYPHASCIDGTGQDDSCASCDKSRSVKREPRDVQVHYGLIASGNQVIKDAMFRESLVKELGGHVLCVEMEAAGLMDNFPCIVIRGICDYADSHKNKAWQEHAAAVAAAFAKELLGYVTVVEIAQEKAVKDVLSHISHAMEAIKEDTIDTKQRLKKQEDMKIITWVSETDYGTQQSDHLRKWHPKTGLWFLGSIEYTKWRRAKRKTLYCSGIPGAGKTTMAAAAINHISRRYLFDKNFGLAYVYFTFSQQREQTVEHVLASLLMQLLRRRTSIPPQIRETLDHHKGHGTRLNRSDLFDCLKLVVSEYEKVFIVLDALDECGTVDQCRMHILNDISKLRSETSVNILATSRKHEEIESKICDQDTLILTIRAPNADMELVLRDQMEAHDQELFTESFREDIASQLSGISKGMFLLAQLHLNALIAMPTRGKIKRALQDLASEKVGLYDVYELAMKRIEGQGHEVNELAKATLLWIVHARGSLSPNELQQALSVIPGADTIDEDDIPTIRTLQSICAGLVTVDQWSGTIRLIHYTAQEYFDRTRERWFRDAHQLITRTCLSYLSLPLIRRDPDLATDFSPHRRVHGLDTVFSLNRRPVDRNTVSRLLRSVRAPYYDETYVERRERYPLFSYAANNWIHHAWKSPNMPEVIEFLIELQPRRWFLPWQYYDCESFLDPCSAQAMKHTRLMLALHMAIHVGLNHAAEALLHRIEAHKDEVCDTTIITHAVRHEREALIQPFCDVPGMDVNGKDEGHMTPLGLAAANGQAEMVQLLLKSGKVDVNIRSAIHWSPASTPLALALQKNHRQVAFLLLKTGKVNMNDITEANRTNLLCLTEAGYGDMIKTLVETGIIDINRKDKASQTPLAFAAENDQREVVQLLLSTSKVDIDSKDEADQTPLALAAKRGHYHVVILLCGTGRLDLNSKIWSGQTLLAFAADNNQGEVVQFLLSTGKVDIDSKDEAGQTPLTLAKRKGHNHVVIMLTMVGKASFNKRCMAGSLLAFAAKNGYEQVVQFLIETSGFDVNSKDQNGQSLLTMAAENGHEKVVETLLAISMTNMNSKDAVGQTPLALAARNGHVKVVQVFVDNRKKVNVDSRDGFGRTPLATAALRGHDKVVEVLIKADKIIMDGKDINGSTPLALAAEFGHLRTVELLIGTGKVDKSSRNWLGYTPQAQAETKGHAAVAELLGGPGKADVNRRDPRVRPKLKHTTNGIYYSLPTNSDGTILDWNDNVQRDDGGKDDGWDGNGSSF